jgi:protein-S-isoprenylcysteine O-methyltransferase Ste14
MSVLELKVPPPIAALFLALLMWVTPAVAGPVPIPYPERVLCAVVLVCIGQGISIAGIVAFRRARTTVNPVKASLASSLFILGVYRYTRNPMYVGLLLTLLAWAVFLANPLAVLWVVVSLLYITLFQNIPEERVLASLFGAEYEAYKGSAPMGMRPYGPQYGDQEALESRVVLRRGV